MPRVLTRLLALLVVGLLPQDAGAQPSEMSRLHWVTNGTVRAAAVDGHTLYVGGRFTRVAPATNLLGPWFAVSTTSGAPAPRLPVADGPVFAIEPDGAGGYFIGGQFTRIGGVARTAIAHVLADGTVDPAFAPTLRPYLYVWPGTASIADVRSVVRSGTTLFIGGNFVIGPEAGPTRGGLAAIDTATATLLPWQGPLGVMAQRILIDGSRAFIAGMEPSGGFGNAVAAAADLATGATVWRRTMNFGNARDAALAAGRLIVVGLLSGPSMTSAVSLNPGTGEIDTAWRPDLRVGAVSTIDGPYAIAVLGGTAYIGGRFSEFGGQARSNLAAVDIATGTVTSWAPQASDVVRDLLPAPSGTSIYAAGAFNRIGTTNREALAEIDAAGAPTTWAPQAYSADVWTLHLSGATLLAGGTAAVAGGVARENLAAFDLDSDTVTSFAPSTNFTVVELAASGGRVFAQRPFVSSLPANAPLVEAFDGMSGAAAWTFPERTSMLLGAWDGGVYVRRSVGYRDELSRFDAGSGVADPSWRLNDAPATRLVVSGNRVYYLGGALSQNGAFRFPVAALDRESGALSPWNPQNLFPSFPVGSPSPTTAVAIGRTLYVHFNWTGSGITGIVAADTESGVPVTAAAMGLQVLDLTAADGLLIGVGRPGPSGVTVVQAVVPGAGALAWSPRLVITEPENSIEARPRVLATATDIVVTGVQNGDIVAPVHGVAVYARQPSAVPTALQATAVDSSVRLTWTPAQPGAASHVIDVGSGPGLSNILVQDTGSSVPALDALAPPGVYFVRVRAQGAAPGSPAAAPTNEIALRVGCTAPPPPPTALTATVSGSIVSLSWRPDPFGTPARHIIEAGSAPALTNLARLAVAGTQSAFTTDAPPGTYYVRVRAEDACGASAPSSEIWLTVGDGVVPSAPAAVTVSGSVPVYTVQWSAVPGATGYILEAGSRPGWSDVARLVVGGTSLGPASVTPGLTYYVRVRAINAAGVGPPSAEYILIAR